MAKTNDRPDRRIAALNFVRKPLAELKPHPRNPRKHPEPGTPQWATLKASLEHDYFDPIVWNKRNGMLVSGHLRVKVLTEAGFVEADVVVVNYDEETHYARMSAANRQQGEDNNVLLTELLAEMEKGGVSHMLAGFTQDGVRELQAKARAEMDRSFLAGSASGAAPTRATEQGQAPDSENFPFVCVVDAAQHAMMMATVEAAKEFFGVPNLQQATLGVFKFFQENHKRKGRK